MPVSTMNSGHTSSMTVEISSVADQFDIKRDENENMKTENADIKNETTNTGKNNADGLNLSCALVSPVNMNEVIEVASGRLSSNSILFNKIMVEVSCQPLEKAEEDDIRNVLNPCVISSDPVYDRLEHVTRIYCTTTQALRQKLKVRDTIFDVAIHSCRRSIYNYINWRTEEHREKSCDTETLYFKVMIYFYKYFKQCALDQNHDISRFIKKSKDETEREFLINTDKEIATAVRRLNQMDTEDHILSSIKTLFQENSETIKKKKDIEPINGEVSSKTKTECAPEIRPDNVDQTKQKVSGYLTRFGDEGAETNKSFHESIECLADHFSQLVVKDNHLEPVEGQSLPTDVRNTPTEGKVKTCFKLKVFHFNPQISVFSRESRKSETRFDQINPWKAVNITTDLRENFTTTSLSPIETTAEKLDELMDAEYIRDDATNTNLDVKLDRPENRDALDNMIERLQTEISTLRPVTERQNYYGIGDAEIIRSMMMREYPGVFTDSTTDTDSYDADTEEDTLGDIYRHLEKLKKKELDENSDGKQATNEERMTEQEIHDQPEVNEERSKGMYSKALLSF